jgi:hypothetical protein
VVQALFRAEGESYQGEIYEAISNKTEAFSRMDRSEGE